MSLLEHNSAAPSRALCAHCGALCSKNHKFCCAGCESVYQLLQAKGLGHYYELRDQYSFAKAKPITEILSPTAPEALKAKSHALLFLEGVHCLGCLWLLEKLPELQKGVQAATLDIAHQTLAVEIDLLITDWNQVFTLLKELGYSAKAIQENEREAEQKKNHLRQLWRIGVAAAGTGNIMLVAICLYGGAKGWLALNFQWLSFALAIPVLTYSAWPIYAAGILPLRKRRISVDLPISLALVAGIVLSLWSLFLRDGKQIYFDSMSMLVLLLLSSRYLLQRVRESFGKNPTSLNFFSEQKVQRWQNSAFSNVLASELAVGDQFQIENDLLPLDAKLLSPRVHGDLSLLTGESLPHLFQKGDLLDSGTKILEPALFEATRSIKESRIGKILDVVQSYRDVRSPSLDLADRMGKYFAVIVLAVAAVVFAVNFAQPDQAIQRALSLVIVTCPCVLAFAIPLSFVKNLQRAAKEGVLIQKAEKLEALADVKSIFFDKTGTLTEGNFTVRSWIGKNDFETQQAVASLEARSQHPIAKSIVRYLNSESPTLAVEDFKETLGLGVSGSIAGAQWEIRKDRSASAAETSSVEVLRNGVRQARIILGDSERKESAKMIMKLFQSGYRVAILSGDKRENVRKLSERLGISQFQADLSPEEKALAIENTPHSLVVGDGANDSIAFQAATVSVAMQGSVELCTRNADIILTKPGIGGLLHAIRLAKQTRSLVRQNFCFTLAYNLLAGYLAIQGQMSPLLAAVLMPMSALTVFTYIHATTLWSTS